MRRFNNKFTRNARPVRNLPTKSVTNAEAFAKCHARYRAILGGDIDSSARRAIRDREFVADFEITARRTLSPRQYEVFRYVHVWASSAESVMARLGYASRLDLVLMLDRITDLLGAALKTVKPYPLYPIHEYFREPERKENGWQRSAATGTPRLPPPQSLRQ